MSPLLKNASKVIRHASVQVVRSFDQLANPLNYFEALEVGDRVQKHVFEMMEESIKATYPTHRVLRAGTAISEEDEEIAEYTWYVMPLDGAQQFCHQNPNFAMGLAVYKGKRPVLSIIYDCLHDDIYMAELGEGAQCNGRKIRVSQEKQLAQAALISNLPIGAPEHQQSYIAILNAIQKEVVSLNCNSITLLDVAAISAGHADLYWSLTIPLATLQIGILLLKESGALITDIKGGERYMDTGTLVVSHAKLVRAFLVTVTPLLD